LDISTRVSSAAWGEAVCRSAHNTPLGANAKEKPICCVAIALGGSIDAHLLTQVHIFQRNSACATLKTFAALRKKLKQCRKSVW
jgi:hypothetical protein